MVRLSTLIAGLILISAGANAQDTIEIRTTTIRANKELPKILYIVPWKEVKSEVKPVKDLELHSLFGDLFDPVLPD